MKQQTDYYSFYFESKELLGAQGGNDTWLIHMAIWARGGHLTWLYGHTLMMLAFSMPPLSHI